MVTIPLCISVLLLSISYWKLLFHPQHKLSSSLPQHLQQTHKETILQQQQDKVLLLDLDLTTTKKKKKVNNNAVASLQGERNDTTTVADIKMQKEANLPARNEVNIVFHKNEESHYPLKKRATSFNNPKKNVQRSAVLRNNQGVKQNKRPQKIKESTLSILDAASLPLHHHNTTNKTMAVFWEAYGPNGEPNYRMDPTALRKSRQRFLQQQHHPNNETTTTTTTSTYQNVLKNYPDNSIQPALWYDKFCDFRGAKYPVEEAGFKLLTQKIRIASNNYSTMNNDQNVANTTTMTSTAASVTTTHSNKQKHRILCGMYTHAGNYELARTAALTWGYKCDGFVAFTTKTTHPDLGMLHFQHAGPETYGNMWQKIRSIWAYIYHHYYHNDEYDYFHLCGDDVLLMVENLRRFLELYEKSTSNKPDQLVFLGQWRPERNYPTVVGGAGYTLNRVALRRLVQELLPICAVDVEKAAEDYIVSYCFRKIGILPDDTRDPATGEQMYHSRSPLQLYTARAGTLKLHGHRGQPGNSAFSVMKHWWENLPHPSNPNVKVGPKDELEAAAMYSVAFHNLKTPRYIAMVNAIIYETCEKDSRMAQSIAEAKGESLRNKHTESVSTTKQRYKRVEVRKRRRKHAA